MSDIADRLRAYIRGGTDDHTKAEVFWYGVLHGCGCGEAERLAQDAWNLFVMFHDRDMRHYSLTYDNLHMEVLGQWMDSLGLIQHGSSIYGSWLSGLGDEVFSIIDALEAT